MTEKFACIRIYAELHWSVRQPKFKVYLNLIEQTVEMEWSEKITTDQENCIFSFSSPLVQNNVLEIVMDDKSDADLLEVDGKWSDHHIDIKEIEVDGIKFETALYRNSEFRHTMPQLWVEDMARKGVTIHNFYPNCAEMRLNGIVTVRFDSPVWRWVTEDLAKIWNEDGYIH